MFFPPIDGQLGWNSEKEEVQYILSWGDRGPQSERVTRVYGNVEVISEGQASNVAILTERISAGNSATIQHPNGKFSIDIPSSVTDDGQDIYFAISTGYHINPPAGKMFVAGGVAYNTTALKLGDKKEVSELLPNVTMHFAYSSDLDEDTLELCQNNAIGEWEPVTGGKVTMANGIVTLTTSKLGAYALMMRKEASLSEVKDALAEATEAIKALELIIANNGNHSNGSVANGNGANGSVTEKEKAHAG